MSKTYTDEELILEIQRFYNENDRVPTKRDMKNKDGYPSYQAYVNHFGSFNNTLEIAGFKLNKVHPKLDGTETCSYCGRRADEILNFKHWFYIDNKRYCYKHGAGGLPDYVTGNLDINSNVGLGRAGEILVAKVLKIANEFDCNRISCGYKFDLIHEKYKKIDVKTRLFDLKYNNWKFGFHAKKEADTYICVGLSNDRKDVEHVWIVPNEGKVRNLKSFTVFNSFESLYNRKHWEVDVEPYDDVWQTMKLDNCKIMVDKSKIETEEEKLKLEKFKKEWFKKLGIVE